MELVLKKDECSGCSACFNICPQDAITMQADDEGFLFPQINKIKCIKCRLCEKTCFYKTEYKVQSDHIGKPKVYAAKHKDLDIRMASQSGGMFTAISDYVLAQGGIIYGVGYDEKFRVCHKRAETREQRDEFRGSKYVQSDLKDIFRKVKEDLQLGSYVMFSGTPCQIAGLVKYFDEKKYEKLILVDIVCHGVPSPMIWERYLTFLMDKYDGKIQKTNFRNKEFGWHSHMETINIDNKVISNFAYTSLFYEHLIFRESCHNCRFTNLKRVSDITIADCWGIEKNMPQIDDNKGVSLVIVNTEKGGGILGKTSSNLELYEIMIEQYMQPQLQYSSKASEKRAEFWQDYNKHRFVYILEKYAGYSLKNRVIKKGKDFLRQFEIIRWLLKRMRNV